MQASQQIRNRPQELLSETNTKIVKTQLNK